jgi:hypothetical protein
MRFGRLNGLLVSLSCRCIIRASFLDNCYLIGDSGYPLEPWLLTPFGQVAPNSREARYNKALSKIRTIIEHVNGMLKARFRCTHGHRAL